MAADAEIPTNDHYPEPLTELRPEEEPVTTGTVFLVSIILMIIGAVWVIMYLRLLER